MKTTENTNKLIAEFMELPSINNKMIAEFMELPSIHHVYMNPYSGEYVEAIELSYDESWDWLMPVMDKIESIGYETSIKTHYVRINPKREESSYEEYIVLVRSDGGSERRLEEDEDILTDKSTIGLKVLVDGVEYINAINTLILAESTNHSYTRTSKKDMIYKAVLEFIKYYNLKIK